jgi:hypothetical protein
MESSPTSAAQDLLQEFWSLLYDAVHSSDRLARDISLLRAWGVYRFGLRGPAHCELCQTSVRLAIPMASERYSGSAVRYSCLCTNCTFAEMELAQRVVMQVGSARVEYSRQGILTPEKCAGASAGR